MTTTAAAPLSSLEAASARRHRPEVAHAAAEVAVRGDPLVTI